MILALLRVSKPSQCFVPKNERLNESDRVTFDYWMKLRVYFEKSIAHEETVESFVFYAIKESTRDTQPHERLWNGLELNLMDNGRITFRILAELISYPLLATGIAYHDIWVEANPPTSQLSNHFGTIIHSEYEEIEAEIQRK